MEEVEGLSPSISTTVILFEPSIGYVYVGW
jgi:hypothetical protein